MRGHCSNASTSPGGSPTFSTRRDSRRRPLIRRAGAPLWSRSESALSPPASWPRRVVNACRGRADPGPADSGRLRGCPPPASRPATRAGPGSHCGGTVLTARGSSRARCRPAADPPWCAPAECSRRCGRSLAAVRPRAIISARASARHSRSTTTDSRAARRSPTQPAPPGRVRRGSRSGRRPRAAPTLPRRTTAGSRNRQ